jgi:hypothetical protein
VWTSNTREFVITKQNSQQLLVWDSFICQDISKLKMCAKLNLIIVPSDCHVLNSNL